MRAVNKLNYLKKTKRLMREAIIAQKETCAETDPLSSYPEKILHILRTKDGITKTSTPKRDRIDTLLPEGSNRSIRHVVIKSDIRLGISLYDFTRSYKSKIGKSGEGKMLPFPLTDTPDPYKLHAVTEMELAHKDDMADYQHLIVYRKGFVDGKELWSCFFLRNDFVCYSPHDTDSDTVDDLPILRIKNFWSMDCLDQDVDWASFRWHDIETEINYHGIQYCNTKLWSSNNILMRKEVWPNNPNVDLPRRWRYAR